MKLYLESLGCARNQVDSEIMIGRLKKAGWTITDDPEQAETIVVNTCSFIEDAVQESIDVILELAEYKKEGSCKRLVVTGCLPERYREEILQSLPEVDVLLGTGAFDQIAKAARELQYSHLCVLPDPDLTELPTEDTPRHLTVPHVAYLKIAEGCSKSCSYCIIPKLRGKQKSRSPEEIVSEATKLIADGVNELVLVAQDTTAYGNDLPTRTNLSRLMESLVNIPINDHERAAQPWLRVLYGHPESIEDSFIDAVASHNNLCSYFDIPIQHASNRILKKMGRQYQKEDLFRLFDRIRSISGDACLRTTVITGFPGETESDFDELFNCIEKIKFDHLGVFNYSDSEDLASHGLGHHVPEDIAMKRYDAIMSRQMDLSAGNNEKYLHRTLPVLIEESPEKGLYIGRTAFQAPEVDGITYVHGDGLTIGGFADVRITDTLEYDLTGEAL